MVLPVYIFNIISVLWCIQLSVKPSRHALFILKNETFLIWSENKHSRLLFENRQIFRWPFKSKEPLIVEFGEKFFIEKFFISSVKICPLFSRMTCFLLITVWISSLLSIAGDHSLSYDRLLSSNVTVTLDLDSFCIFKYD